VDRSLNGPAGVVATVVEMHCRPDARCVVA